MSRLLRVAYLLESTELCGGVKVVLEQARALARRGHRVAIVSPRPAQDWFVLGPVHLELSAFRDSRELACAQVRVATFWTTVAPALEGARGPVFHLCQGYEGELAFYSAARSQIEAAYARPTHRLAITETLAEKLRRAGFGPAINVGQAFDARPFHPAPLRAAAIPTVLLVGMYERDVKGIDVALEGLRIWRSRGGSFRLCRVLTEPLDPEERDSGLVDECHRFLHPSRMPFAYRAADLFIGPSRPKEGFGLPVVEALASGLPCLLSDTATHREIAGDAAWYFADGDPESLANALPQMTSAEARERARALGPAAAALFDPGPVAQRLEDVFLRALEADGRASGDDTSSQEVVQPQGRQAHR